MARVSSLLTLICALLVAVCSARPLQGAGRRLQGGYRVEEYAGPGDSKSKRFHAKWQQAHEKLATVAGADVANVKDHKYDGTDRDAIKLIRERMHYANKYRLALKKAQMKVAKNPDRYKNKEDDPEEEERKVRRKAKAREEAEEAAEDEAQEETAEDEAAGEATEEATEEEATEERAEEATEEPAEEAAGEAGEGLAQAMQMQFNNPANGMEFVGAAEATADPSAALAALWRARLESAQPQVA